MAKTGLIEIEVPASIRELVETEAKSLCEEREVKFNQLNQAMTAVAAARALKGIGVDFDRVNGDSADKRIQKVLAILKIASNASALKQKISGEKTTKSETLMEGAAELV